MLTKKTVFVQALVDGRQGKRWLDIFLIGLAAGPVPAFAADCNMLAGLALFIRAGNIVTLLESIHWQCSPGSSYSGAQAKP